MWTFTEGYFCSIASAAASSLDGVRDARMRAPGSWEAIASAVEYPRPAGLTPVMTTGGDGQSQASVQGHNHEPIFPLIDAPRAFAASVPVVSLLNSGLDVMMQMRAGTDTSQTTSS